MRGYRTFVAIADVHIGIKHIPPKEMKTQLKKNFFEVVEKMDPIDGIFVCGDVSHTILSLNSEGSNVYLWFFERLYKLAKKKGATVIVLKGTMSHDVDQLENIKHYQNNDDGVDFRVYDTVEETTIWDDYHVLVLPDVKVKQRNEIDALLKKGKYDLILGHGTMTSMQFIVQESENEPTKTYLYDPADLEGACVGPVLFGHVHQYMRLGTTGQVRYVGPFTMLERGWQDAGFVVGGICNEDRSRFKVEHYINSDSANYYDLNVTEDMLREIPVEEIIATIQEIADEAKPNDLFTLRITRGDFTAASDRVMIIENVFRRDGRFSIIKKVKTAREEERERTHEERRKKYEYLLDESTDLPSILYTYYISDVKPTFPNSGAPEANLTEEDFRQALENKT